MKILEDLQALLMTCQWPLEVETQTEDPSWMLIGFAINAAQHMGLDKAEDDNILGQHNVGHPLQIYNSIYRRRTWMQAFQISTQMNLWQGFPAHMSPLHPLSTHSRSSARQKPGKTSQP
jgi:hypothetical protein